MRENRQGGSKVRLVGGDDPWCESAMAYLANILRHDGNAR